MAYKSKITIAIAFKKHSLIKSLVNCIKSFLDQTLLPEEIIVVGKREDLFDLDKHFTKKDYTLIRRIYSKADKNEARNVGIKAARSTYVLFVDHDMRAERNLLSKCAKLSKKYDALFIPEKGSGGNFWEECQKLQKEFVRYDLDTITPRFFKKNIFGSEEKPFSSDFGELDEWGFNLFLQKHKVKKGVVDSYVVIKENRSNLLKEIKNKYSRGLWLFNFYKADDKEAWRRVNPIKRGILFYSGKWRYLFTKPTVFVGLLFLKTISLASFFGGAVVGFFTQPYRKIVKSDIRDFYNSIAPSYLDVMYKKTKWGRYVDRKEKESITEIWKLYKDANIKREKILDLGMGPGRWSRLFLNAGFSKVVGLDISDKMVLKVKREIKNVKFEPVVADIEKIPYKNSYFDKVFCFRTFKYLPNPKEASKEIVRVTKNQGEVLLELSNKSLQNRFLKLLSHFVVLINPNVTPESNWWYFDKTNLYSLKDIKSLLSDLSGIKIKKISPLFMLPSVGVPKVFDKYLFKTLVLLDNLFMIILPKALFARSWIVQISKFKSS